LLFFPREPARDKRTHGRARRLRLLFANIIPLGISYFVLMYGNQVDRQLVISDVTSTVIFNARYGTPLCRLMTSPRYKAAAINISRLAVSVRFGLHHFNVTEYLAGMPHCFGLLCITQPAASMQKLAVFRHKQPQISDIGVMGASVN